MNEEIVEGLSPPTGIGRCLNEGTGESQIYKLSFAVPSLGCVNRISPAALRVGQF
jgi:hypothetical protein